jgi:hypothetical protein
MEVKGRKERGFVEIQVETEDFGLGDIQITNEEAVINRNKKNKVNATIHDVASDE